MGALRPCSLKSVSPISGATSRPYFPGITPFFSSFEILGLITNEQ
jgi:hypothetical protein